MKLLHETAAFLGATLVAVPLFKRLGLGSVLGYLAAGVAIGPQVLGLVGEVEGTMQLAEFGVVLLLFLIGLELQPSRLWSLRGSVFGVGGAQLLCSSLLLGALGLGLGLSKGEAAVAGLGLSLSSTAFAIQLLAERNQLTSRHGRAAFGILLMQDLAVIPLLALLPAAHRAGPAPSPLRISLIAAGVLGLTFSGRYLLRPFFRWVAELQSQELFTASTLGVVVAVALLMESIGLSMALGSFLAGVLLSDSEYRHELEADIEPFKGILLGLFFISVGMSVNLSLIVQQPLAIAAAVAALFAIKGAVLYGLGRATHLGRRASIALAATVAQGGEFAFVLFGAAAASGLMPRSHADLGVVVVSLSMALSPLLFVLQERWIQARPRHDRQAGPYDDSLKDETPVIIAGFGRVGQVVGRILRARRIPFTALDANPGHIDFVQKFGNKAYYGDASRLELLHAAQADKARVLVLAIDDVGASLKTVELVKKHFPKLKLYVRARNRQHAYELLELGVEHVFRETFPSSLEMTETVLRGLGFSFSEARSTIERFREYDERLIQRNFVHRTDEDRLQKMALEASKELEQLFERDDLRGRSGRRKGAA